MNIWETADDKIKAETLHNLKLENEKLELEKVKIHLENQELIRLFESGLTFLTTAIVS